MKNCSSRRSSTRFFPSNKRLMNAKRTTNEHLRNVPGRSFWVSMNVHCVHFAFIFRSLYVPYVFIIEGQRNGLSPIFWHPSKFLLTILACLWVNATNKWWLRLFLAHKRFSAELLLKLNWEWIFLGDSRSLSEFVKKRFNSNPKFQKYKNIWNFKNQKIQILKNQKESKKLLIQTKKYIKHKTKYKQNLQIFDPWSENSQPLQAQKSRYICAIIEQCHLSHIRGFPAAIGPCVSHFCKIKN